jgi:hypothetical protein
VGEEDSRVQGVKGSSVSFPMVLFNNLNGHSNSKIASQNLVRGVILVLKID